ncbi:MAG: glycosyltransferase family 4 protein [Candidatus Omnitrophica bacterium]|nr:glycosyltransferase family 4 protein [Candidatus Omnitrophota bacterium]
MSQKYKIIHLKNGAYEACIIKRNALNRVLSMHLNHLFEKVYIVFFKADSNKLINVGPDCTIFDISGFGSLFSKLKLKFLDSFFSEINLLTRAFKTIKENNISVITADEPFLTGLNAIILSFLTGKPAVIYNLADFELYYKTGGRRNMPYLPRKVELCIERIVFKKAAMVITDRKFYRDYVIRRGALPLKCKSIRTTTDSFYFTASPDKGFKREQSWEGKKILFYFGRLHLEKKIDCLVRCLALIKQKRSDVIMLLAGEGPHRLEVEELCQKLRIEQDVYFLGNKSSQDLVNIMSISDILIASHAGYSLLEMALSGKPIIAFDYEWHSEFIENNVNGILVKDGDYQSMAEEALKVLFNADIYLQMGLKAKEKALSFNHPVDSLNDERKCYEILLDKQKAVE